MTCYSMYAVYSPKDILSYKDRVLIEKEIEMHIELKTRTRKLNTDN